MTIHTNLCPACFEEQYGFGNPCQCFSCDPDGTRYVCTCEFIMFDEEVIKNLLNIKKLLVDMKTRFDHVRGDVESREVMSETIDRAIEIIKCAADTPAGQRLADKGET